METDSCYQWLPNDHLCCIVVNVIFILEWFPKRKKRRTSIYSALLSLSNLRQTDKLKLQIKTKLKPGLAFSTFEQPTKSHCCD